MKKLKILTNLMNKINNIRVPIKKLLNLRDQIIYGLLNLVKTLIEALELKSVMNYHKFKV